MSTQTWHPATVDFWAMSMRSNHMKSPGDDAKIKVGSVQEFFTRLLESHSRFNFFGYLDVAAPNNPVIVMMAGVTRTNLSVMSDVLDLATIDDLNQRIGGGSSDPLVTLIQDIREKNPHVAERRELRLYLCAMEEPTQWPVTELATALGELLEMDVFVLRAAIWFRPELHQTPLDEIRGQVSLDPNGTITTDVHTLDGEMDKFP